jgi:hypothetical protein
MSEEAMAKIPVGIRVDYELMERLRNAIWHIGQGLTITSVTVEALEEAVAELETRNGGKPFPTRQSKLAKSPLPRKKKKNG